MNWFSSRRQATIAPRPAVARLGLEELGGRCLPSTTPLEPALLQPVLVAPAANSTTVSIDFTNSGGIQPQGQPGRFDDDTYTITVYHGTSNSVINVNVSKGSSPGGVALAVAGALRTAGFQNVVVNGGIVAFDVPDYCTTLISNTSTVNGVPYVSEANASVSR